MPAVRVRGTKKESRWSTAAAEESSGGWGTNGQRAAQWGAAGGGR